MWAGNVDRDGSALSTSEARKRNRYDRPGQMPSDEHSNELVTLAIEALVASERTTRNHQPAGQRTSSGERTGGPYPVKVLVTTRAFTDTFG